MHYNRLQQVQDDLLNHQITCTQLTEHYISETKRLSHLNAFLEVFETDALSQAKSIDDKIAKGEKLGPLFGLVISIKDNICYKQHKVSVSSKILEGYVSLYSSTVVERLLAADAIILGRTNCDEFAMGSSNENSAFGPVKNFQDEKLVPGGSSGGSAVAVQSGMSLAALGSDTGGSIRQPASFCGVVGFKPTYGVVSRYGLIAYASSFDQIGPFTPTVEDTERIMAVIAGPDEYDSTAAQTFLSYHKKPKEKARIAYFEEVLMHEGLDEEVRQSTMNLIEKLRLAGHTVEPVAFPYLEYLIPAYYVLTTAEASSNLARFDGVHYGYRSPEASNMDEVYKRSRSEGFGPEVQNRIMLGTFVLSSGYYDAYYAKGQKLRRLLVDTVTQIFQNHDFIISPTAPSTAFPFGEKGDDPVAMYLQDIYCVLANLTGTPAISIPLSTASNGLPIGTQLMAPAMNDAELLAFSSYLQQEFAKR